jgi:hypothetical protein
VVRIATQATGDLEITVKFLHANPGRQTIDARRRDAEIQRSSNAYFRAIAKPVVVIATTDWRSVRVAARAPAICRTIRA